MINEISNSNDHLGQIQKPNNRQKDIVSAGTHSDKSGEFDVRDVVDISSLKPVQPVSEDKNEINFMTDPKNAEKNNDELGHSEGPADTSKSSEPTQAGKTSTYDKKEDGIGQFIDTMV